jgi:hypothetical protein
MRESLLTGRRVAIWLLTSFETGIDLTFAFSHVKDDLTGEQLDVKSKWRSVWSNA